MWILDILICESDTVVLQIVINEYFNNQCQMFIEVFMSRVEQGRMVREANKVPLVTRSALCELYVNECEVYVYLHAVLYSYVWDVCLWACVCTSRSKILHICLCMCTWIRNPCERQIEYLLKRISSQNYPDDMCRVFLDFLVCLVFLEKKENAWVVAGQLNCYVYLSYNFLVIWKNSCNFSSLLVFHP